VTDFATIIAMVIYLTKTQMGIGVLVLWGRRKVP
jgi:hypothetical protein